MSTHDDEARSTINSTTGGVMTAEVGAITGELEVATRSLNGGLIEVAVEGSPIDSGDVGNLTPRELRELHERVVRHLETPGKIVDGNEQATSLLKFS